MDELIERIAALRDSVDLSAVFDGAEAIQAQDAGVVITCTTGSGIQLDA